MPKGIPNKRYTGEFKQEVVEAYGGFVIPAVMNHQHGAADLFGIGKEIHLLLRDRSFFHRRFAEAYPEVIYRTDRIAARIAARVEAIKAETERLRMEAEQRTAEVKHEVEVNLEPTALVKNTIIEKQEALIDLLYREDTASDKMKALKHEVEEKQAVLQKRRDLLPKL